MIKIDVSLNRDGPDKVVAAGPMEIIAAEIAAAIGQVYNCMAKNSKLEASRFRVLLALSLMPDSPAWEYDGGGNGVTVSVDLGTTREEAKEEAGDA